MAAFLINFSILTTILLTKPIASQRPIIRGFTLLLGNCADMFLNEKPIQVDVQSCANECQRYTGCRGFSFDYMEQNCWLKWGLCDRIKPARLTPVVFYKNELWGFTAELGSCPGQMAVPPVFTDVVACASQCRTMANCSGFTYDFEGDVCYLKAATCPTTLPSDVLAIESWVKYFRKDFWVPAALERTRKYLDDDDPAASASLNSDELISPQQQPASIEQNTSNPLEMVFFDNNNAPAALTLPQNMPVQSTGENDPWEAYANPSDGSDYVAIADDGVNILIHRATIANASEATCSRACSLDAHCSYFYLLRTEVTMLVSKEEPPKTDPVNGSSTEKPPDDQQQEAVTIIQQNCVLFSKWNGSSGISSSKRRQPDEGKLFQKIAHIPRSKATSQNQLPSQPQPISSPSHQVSLVNLKKRKRHLDENNGEQNSNNRIACSSSLLFFVSVILNTSWRLL